MDNDVLIALIAAIAAVVVALIGIVPEIQDRREIRDAAEPDPGTERERLRRRSRRRLGTASGALVFILLALGLITQIIPVAPTPTEVAQVTETAPAVIPSDTPTEPPPSDTPIIPTTPPPLLPDLSISKFSLDPSTPTQGSPVSVSVGVYNRGTGSAGAFTMQWWAGENYATPACTWRVDSLVPQEERILTCTYDGYPSWYSSITTKADIDSAGEIAESDEGNNTETITIRVSQPSPVQVVFDSFPDGTPITTDRILEGDEFLAKGIRLAGAPESSYCADATMAAVRRPGTYSGINFYFLTTASPGEVNRCNGVPVAILFTSSVRAVTLTFAGASTTYTMKAYDSAGRLLGTTQQDAVFGGGTFEVSFRSDSANISRVTFGSTTALTAIMEISYEQ